MTKKTYRWLTIGGAVFLTIAFVAAVVLSARSTKKASADAITGIQYTTQFYSPRMYTSGNIRCGTTRFLINIVLNEVGQYNVTVSATGGNMTGSINMVGTNSTEKQGTLYVNNQPNSVRLFGFLTNQVMQNPTYAYVMNGRNGAAGSYTYWTRIYFYFGTETDTTYIALNWTTDNVFDKALTDADASTLITEYRETRDTASSAYDKGYIDGQNSMTNKINSARDEGYNSGYAAGAQQASSLGNILLGIGGIPFETLQSIFDFDLLGINISALIMSILTAAIAIWIVKLFI